MAVCGVRDGRVEWYSVAWCSEGRWEAGYGMIKER